MKGLRRSKINESQYGKGVLQGVFSRNGWVGSGRDN